MNDRYSEIKRTGYYLLVCLFAIAMASCGPQQEAQHLQTRVDNALNDLDKDRKAVRLELVQLRKDIDQRLLDIEEDLMREDIPEQQRADQEQLLQELQQQRFRVQQALIEVERADASEWEEVKDRSRNTTKQIDGWFDRQAELEDIRAHGLDDGVRPV